MDANDVCSFAALYQNPRVTWGQCLKTAELLGQRHNRLLLKVLKLPINTGGYIDANVELKACDKSMQEIERWCYSNIPHWMYDEVCQALGFEPQSSYHRGPA